MNNVFTSNQHTREVYLPSVTIESNVDTDEMFLLSKDFQQINRSFQKLVLEAVDESLSSLGETSKHAIYSYLEETFKIDKQHIPSKTEKFTRALEKILGPGAKLLEIQIMKTLYQKIGHNFKYQLSNKKLTFTEYLSAVHTFLNTTSKTELTKLL
jgi:hypothetical protein